MSSRRRFHHLSEHGPGPRRCLDRQQRLDWRLRAEKSFLAREITEVAWRVARALERLLGPDGQLDPSYETLAAVADVSRRSVSRALPQLYAVGLLRKTRRLVTEGGNTRQTSNAYELLLPAAPPPAALPLPARRVQRAISFLDSSSAIVAPLVAPAVSIGLPPGWEARVAAKIAAEKQQRRARLL